MPRIYLYFFISLFVMLSCHRVYNPALYPVSATNTIKFFGFCMNGIEDKDRFNMLGEILLGSAREDFLKLKEILYEATEDPLIRRQREAYVAYAKHLSIEITSIEREGNIKARVYVLFFNTKSLEEEKKILSLVMEDKVWKIANIATYSN